MDEITKELINQLIRLLACVKLLEETTLTKRQHEALWELKQKSEQTLDQLLVHLANIKEEA